MIDFKLNVSPVTQLRIDEFVEISKKVADMRYSGNQAYVKILNDYYYRECVRRMNLLVKIDQNDDFRYCTYEHIKKRENIIDFCVDWCWTFDPRAPASGLPSDMPWIPFPRQVEMIEWFYGIYLNSAMDRRGGMVEKAREVGATWVFVLCFVHEFLFSDGFIGGFGSNKAINVDSLDNPKAIFTKIRHLLSHLPVWLLPRGYNPKKNDKLNNISNPEKPGTALLGDAGINIGRSGRYSAYLVDEKAFVEASEKADAALSYATSCQIDLSSANGTNGFYQKRHSEGMDTRIFRFSWHEDPRKNKEWYEAEKLRWRYAPEIFKSEVDIDYTASIADTFIKTEHILAAVNIEIPNFTEEVTTALDVGGGGQDKNALAVTKGNYTTAEEWYADNGIDVAADAIQKSREVKAINMNYDRIGVGYTIYSYVDKVIKALPFAVTAVDAGATASDTFYKEYGRYGHEIFMNARAEWYYLTAIAFQKTYEYTCGVKHPPEELISIPNDSDMISQLASFKRKMSKSGKIGVESKIDLRKRGIKSPNMADAVVMSRIPHGLAVQKVVERQVDAQEFNIDFNNLRETTYIIISVWMEQSQKTSVTCSIWNARDQKFYLFLEEEFQRGSPERIKRRVLLQFKELNEFFDVMKYPRTIWLGNKPFFTSDHKYSELAESFMRNGIILQENSDYEEYGAIEMFNTLNRNAKATVHRRCETTRVQLCEWSIYKNKPDAEYGFARSVSNTMSVIRGSSRLKKPPEPPRPYMKKKGLHQHDGTAGKYDWMGVIA